MLYIARTHLSLVSVMFDRSTRKYSANTGTPIENVLKMISPKKVIWCLLVIKIVSVFGREFQFRVDKSENRHVHPTGYIYKQFGSDASQLIYLNKGEIASNVQQLQTSKQQPNDVPDVPHASIFSVQDNNKNKQNIFNGEQIVNSKEKQKIVEQFVELANNYFKDPPFPKNKENAPISNSTPPFQSQPKTNTYETHEDHGNYDLQPQSTYGNQLRPYGYVFQMTPSNIMQANNHMMKNAKLLFSDNFNLFRPPRERRKIFIFPIPKKPQPHPVHPVRPMIEPPKKHEPPKKAKKPPQQPQPPNKHEHPKKHSPPQKQHKSHEETPHEKPREKEHKKEPEKSSDEEEPTDDDDDEKSKEEEDDDENDENDESDDGSDEDKNEDEEENDDGDDDDDDHDEKDNDDDDHDEKKKKKKHDDDEEENEKKEEEHDDEKEEEEEENEEKKSEEKVEDEKEEKESDDHKSKGKKHKDHNGESEKKSKSSKGGKKYASHKTTKKGVHKKHKGKGETVKNKKRQGHSKARKKSDKGGHAVKESGFKMLHGFKYNEAGRRRKGFKTNKKINKIDKFGIGKKNKYDETSLADHLNEKKQKEADEYDKSLKFDKHHGNTHGNEHKKHEKEHESKQFGDHEEKETDMHDESKSDESHMEDDSSESGESGGKFKEQKLHKRGIKTTGYHNVFHKDEYKKVHTFYDDADHRGNFKKFGSEYENNESKKITNHDQHSLKSGNDDENTSDSQDYRKENTDHDDSGHHKKYGHDKEYADEKDHFNKSGSNKTHHTSE